MSRAAAGRGLKTARMARSMPYLLAAAWVAELSIVKRGCATGINHAGPSP